MSVRPILPDCIAVNPYYAAVSQTIEARYEALPVQNVLTCMFDTVPSAVLDTLAAENNMLGYWGWYWATDDTIKRNLLKNANLLKSKVGTCFAITHALEMIGYPNCRVIENLGGADYDGSHIFDGSITYNGLNWACFKVQMPLQYYSTLTTDEILDLENLINTYKRLVCHLIALESYVPIYSVLGLQII